MLVSVEMLIVACQAARRWNVWFSIQRSASGKQTEVAQSASNSLRCAVTMPSIARYVLLVPVHSVWPSLNTNNPHSKETAKMSVPYTTYISHVSAWAVCAPLLRLIFPHIVFHSFSHSGVLLVLHCHNGFPIATDFPLTITCTDFVKVSCHFSFSCHCLSHISLLHCSNTVCMGRGFEDGG